MTDSELFNLHPIPTWIYSVTTHRILAVNDAMLECYGYTREQLLQMTIDQIRPTEDRARFQLHLKNDLDTRNSTGTWRHLRSDGSIIDVEVKSRSISFEGQSARMVVARDVTGNMDNLEKFNLALSAGNFAIWEYNIADEALHWDPAHSGVYGIDRSLFPTNKEQFLKLVLPKHRAPLEVAFDKCIETGAPYDCEFQIDLPSLGVRWRRAVGKRINDPSGRPMRIIGIGFDTTERKQLEERLHRSEKLEAVGRLASGIAHDFNNILTVISGFSYLIKSEDVSTSVLEAATEISTAADRAARLVKQLLEFSSTVPVDAKPIDISKVTAETIVLLRRLLPESIRVVVEPAPGPVIVCADPGQVEQLIMNMCLNARDAMSDGGILTVKVSKTADSLACIAISDTGTGMLPQVQARIFEPFFTTKEFGSGCGLGLSIVHGIVKQLNGSIDVHSSINEGSTFTVLLPLSEETDPGC